MASAMSTQNRPLKSTLKLIDTPPIFNKSLMKFKGDQNPLP